MDFLEPAVISPEYAVLGIFWIIFGASLVFSFGKLAMTSASALARLGQFGGNRSTRITLVLAMLLSLLGLVCSAYWSSASLQASLDAIK